MAALVAALALAWSATFVVAVPFFPAVVASGVASGAAGLWLRRRIADDVALPDLRITPAQALLALVVAAVHLGAGHGLLLIGEQLLPALTETAAGVYRRTSDVPVTTRIVLAGLVVAPLEEVFWRGAAHPLLADALQRRGAAGQRRWPRGSAAAWLVPVVASTLAYAVFHLVTLQLALVAAALLGGLVWGALVERTRSVGACMLAHGAWTILMVLVPPV